MLLNKLTTKIKNRFRKNSRTKASPKLVSGFTFIEMIIYTAILAVIFVVVVNTLLTISRSYRSVKLANDLNNSASLSLERLTREIRAAGSVNVNGSVLENNPGQLVLNTTEGGSPTTFDFYVENGSLKLKKGGLLSGVLTRDNIVIDNLIFRHKVGSSSEFVKIEMTLTGTEKGITKTENFYTSVVLRGSY